MPTPGKKPRKPRKLSKHQLLVKAFLADDANFNWPNEMRIAGILMKTYGFDFLISFKGSFKVKSLVWFLGDNGKKFLQAQKNLRNLKLYKDKFDLEPKPVAKKTKVFKKPTSLREFLNIFNK